jgi:hypothetical protein
LDSMPEREKASGMTEASRKKIQDFTAKTGAQLWIGHDINFFSKQKHAPQYIRLTENFGQLLNQCGCFWNWQGYARNPAQVLRIRPLPLCGLRKTDQDGLHGNVFPPNSQDSGTPAFGLASH